MKKNITEETILNKNKNDIQDFINKKKIKVMSETISFIYSCKPCEPIYIFIFM